VEVRVYTVTDTIFLPLATPSLVCIHPCGLIEELYSTQNLVEFDYLFRREIAFLSPRNQ